MTTETQVLFPLRTSDYIPFLDTQKPESEIILAPDERERVLAFEGELFDRLLPILEIKLGTHSVYPLFFTTAEGWEQFKATYSQNQSEVAEWEKPETKEEAAAFFWKVKNLKGIDKKSRDSLADNSMHYARDIFASDISNGKPIEEVEDPYRISRLVNPPTLIKKVERLREYKKSLKNSAQTLKEGIDETPSPETEAKEIILGLYNRYVNTRIAELYDDAYVALHDPTLSKEDQLRVAALFPPHARRIHHGSETRILAEGSGKVTSLARIDRFYQGADRTKKGIMVLFPLHFLHMLNNAEVKLTFPKRNITVDN